MGLLHAALFVFGVLPVAYAQGGLQPLADPSGLIGNILGGTAGIISASGDALSKLPPGTGGGGEEGGPPGGGGGGEGGPPGGGGEEGGPPGGGEGEGGPPGGGGGGGPDPMEEIMSMLNGGGGPSIMACKPGQPAICECV